MSKRVSRRGFLALLALSAVSAIVAAPVIEAATTVFTPPEHGWKPCKCGKHHGPSDFEAFKKDYVHKAAKNLADEIDRRAFASYQDAYNGAQNQINDRLSMRFVKQYDIKADTPTRLDVLYGVGVIQPNLAARISNVAVAPDIDLSQQRIIDWVEKG